MLPSYELNSVTIILINQQLSGENYIYGLLSTYTSPFNKRVYQRPFSFFTGKIKDNDIVQSPSNVSYNICEFSTYR